MKLPILGIAIILFLQLGFTAYNALNRPIGSLYVIKSPTTGTIPIAGIPDDGVVEAEFYDSSRLRFQRTKNNYAAISTANVRKNKRRTDPGVYFSNTLIKIPAAKPDSQLAAFQKSWEADKIKYPRLPPANAKFENTQHTARLDTKPEKRSFASKTASFIKKPYDWIKALGSKIN